MIEKECLICNKKFSVRPHRIDTAKYCSDACRGASSRKSFTRNCAICETEFSYIATREGKAKYCSRSCYYKGQKGKGTIEYSCHHCHKIFLSSPSKKPKYCSKACIGKESLKTFKAKFTTVRQAMLRRGEINKCEVCGYDEVKQILGVHHIDQDRNNNERSNLLVVCPMCHSLIHNKHIAH